MTALNAQFQKQSDNPINTSTPMEPSAPPLSAEAVAAAISSPLPGSAPSLAKKSVEQLTPTGEPDVTVVFGEPDTSSEESDSDSEEMPGALPKAKVCAAAAAVVPNQTWRPSAPPGEPDVIAFSQFPLSVFSETSNNEDEDPQSTAFCAAAAALPAEAMDFKQAMPAMDEEPAIGELFAILNKYTFDKIIDEKTKDKIRALVDTLEKKIFRDPRFAWKLKSDPRFNELCEQISRLIGKDSQCFIKTGLKRYKESMTKKALTTFGEKLFRLKNALEENGWEGLMPFYVQELYSSKEPLLLNTLEQHIPQMHFPDLLPKIDLEKIPKKFYQRALGFEVLKKHRTRGLLVQEFEQALKTRNEEHIWTAFENIRRSALFNIDEDNTFVSQIFEATDNADSAKLYQYFCEIRQSKMPEVLKTAALAVRELYFERFAKALEGGEEDVIAANFQGLLDFPWMTYEPIRDLINALPLEQAWNPKIIGYVKFCGQKDWGNHFQPYMNTLTMRFNQYLKKGDTAALLLEVKKLVETGLFDNADLGGAIWRENMRLFLISPDLLAICYPRSVQNRVRDLTRRIEPQVLDEYYLNPNADNDHTRVTKLCLHFRCPVDQNQRTREQRLERERVEKGIEEDRQKDRDYETAAHYSYR